MAPRLSPNETTAATQHGGLGFNVDAAAIAIALLLAALVRLGVIRHIGW